MQIVRRLWQRSLRREEAGNILVVAGALMPLLIGASGLAVDTTTWTYWRRELQREADSAALAGAFAKAQAKDVRSAATQDVSRTNRIRLSGLPDIQNAPTTGSFTGNINAVRVSLATQQRLPFSGVFMASAPTIQAHATAAIVSNGDYCALALTKASTAGITMQGNAALNFGCGLATNSIAANAVTAGGSSSITASPVAAVGGVPASSNFGVGTQLLPYSLPQPDPFANIPDPVLPACQGQVSVGPNSSQTLSPGCYKGMNIKGSVTLNPGTYYLDGGTFSAGSQAVITGDSVTIVLTSSTAASNPSSIASVNINGGATIQLTAPSTGTYAGLIFYQDRRAIDGSVNQINGNAASTLQGALYFPSQELDYTGTSGMATSCLQLVALRLTFSGNTSVSNSCPAGSGASSFKGVQVRLVE